MFKPSPVIDDLKASFRADYGYCVGKENIDMLCALADIAACQWDEKSLLRVGWMFREGMRRLCDATSEERIRFLVRMIDDVLEMRSKLHGKGTVWTRPLLAKMMPEKDKETYGNDAKPFHRAVAKMQRLKHPPVKGIPGLK